MPQTHLVTQIVDEILHDLLVLATTRSPEKIMWARPVGQALDALLQVNSIDSMQSARLTYPSSVATTNRAASWTNQLGLVSRLGRERILSMKKLRETGTPPYSCHIPKQRPENFFRRQRRRQEVLSSCLVNCHTPHTSIQNP